MGNVVAPAAQAVLGSMFDEFMESGGEHASASSAVHAAAAGELRQRPKAARHSYASSTMLTANVDVAKQRISSSLAPRLERCYQQRTRIRNALCGCIVVGTAIGIVVGLLSDQSAYVDDALRPTYARSGVDGVRFDRPVEHLTCSEVEGGLVQRQRRRGEPTMLDDVRMRMRSLLDQDELSCICAPMVGSHRSLALVRSARSVITMYNVEVDSQWDGRIDDTTQLDVDARSRVSESQEHLFPGRSEPVKKVRWNNVRLIFIDDQCATQSVVLRKKPARCMQSCVDLMGGRSIYDDSE